MDMFKSIVFLEYCTFKSRVETKELGKETKDSTYLGSGVAVLPLSFEFVLSLLGFKLFQPFSTNSLMLSSLTEGDTEF